MEVLFKKFDSKTDQAQTVGRAWVQDGVAKWEPSSLGLDQGNVHDDDRLVTPQDGEEFLRGLVFTFRSAPYFWAEFANGEGSGNGQPEAGREQGAAAGMGGP